jgi:hypothetical protein
LVYRPNISRGWVLSKQILYFYTKLVGKPTKLAAVITQPSSRPNYKDYMFFVLHTSKGWGVNIRSTGLISVWVLD